MHDMQKFDGMSLQGLSHEAALPIIIAISSSPEYE